MLCSLVHSYKGLCSRREWDFDEMFNEDKCWAYFRFHKWQMPLLLLLLKFDQSGGPDGIWRARNKNTGEVMYKFEPMELLCIFLLRLASSVF